MGIPNLLIVAGATGTTADQRADADYVCTGTNDDTTLNEASAAMPSIGGTIQLVGEFNLSQMVRFLIANTNIDATQAIFNIPSGWAAAGRAAIQLGRNHIFPLGVPSLPGGSGTAVLFTADTGGGAGYSNGDSGYLYTTGGTYPDGMDNSTLYYVRNYTPTGFGDAQCNLSTTPTGPLVTSTSVPSNTFSLAAYIATADSTTNMITLSDPSAATIPAGTPVVFVVEPAGETGLLEGLPYFLGVASGESYALFLDPALQNQATITVNGTVLLDLMIQNIRWSGGIFNVAVGNSPAMAVGVIKDNVTDLNAVISGITFNWGTSSGFNGSGCSIYQWGHTTRITGSNFLGGDTAIQAVGRTGKVDNNYINGAYQGVSISNATQAPSGYFCYANVIENCVSNGIEVVDGSLGAQIFGNYVYNSINGCDIRDYSGNGTMIGPNQTTFPGNFFAATTSYPTSPLTVAVADVGGQTTALIPLLQFVPGECDPNSTMEVKGYLNITALGAGNLAVQVTYVDENFNPQTYTLPLTSTSGTIATAAISPGNYAFASNPIQIFTGYGSVNVNVIFGAGTSSVSYDAGAIVYRIK